MHYHRGMQRVLAAVVAIGCGSTPATAPPPAAPIANAAPVAPPPVEDPLAFPKLDPAIYDAQIGRGTIPKIDPLPERRMGIKACDDILLRITKCTTMPNKPKVFERAMWDVARERLEKGEDRAAIEKDCADDAASWDARMPNEHPGC
jgi:hypothetical protein